MFILHSIKKLLKLEENIQSVEEIRKKRQQYYIEFKKKNPNYQKERAIKLKAVNYERSLLYQTKAFAKRRGIEFKLIIKDIVIPDICPLTETEITKSVGEGRMLSNPYVYRKDESIGYTKENIIITCVLANHLRTCATKEQIVAFAKNIRKMYS